MTTSFDPHLIDLDAYFRRIGFNGPAFPTLPTLQALHSLHTQTIPFENIDPLLLRPVHLDLDSLENKLVHSRRGGYCFEHNLLFAHVLQRLGYSVSRLVARVLWGHTDDTPSPRSHMLLLVQLDQRRHIVDVGFGGNTLTTPLPLDASEGLETPHGWYRVQQAQGDYLLQLQVQDEWRSLYRFDLTEQLPVDYEATNYFLSTSERSMFRQSLTVAIATPRERHSLLNDRLTTRHADGHSTQTRAANADELMAMLSTMFGIDTPEPDRFATIWAGLR